MLRRAVVTFQGFTEDLSRETGTEALYRDVIRPRSSAEMMTLLPVEWDHPPGKLVGALHRMGVPSVVVIGYSWGAGYGAQRFAAAALRAGIAVDLMLLCDPVYRPLWLPPFLGTLPLALRALLPDSAVIRVPHGVRRVAAVRQAISLPRGHKLHLGPATASPLPRVLPYSHTAIDSAPEWHALVDFELAAIQP